jgi:hypothetical protein
MTDSPCAGAVQWVLDKKTRSFILIVSLHVARSVCKCFVFGVVRVCLRQLIRHNDGYYFQLYLGIGNN